ncbi:hypothetical protein ACFR99_11255 [Haloarchaeobius amylolyticus]|uniref:Major facilitator superfamily (MFS) profile domain-containing protein n=1 Tax=Haloarchaeobius amylolyticus TaxID=1198296 RepID=A0ABD6BGD6_9EURY
MSKFVGRLLVLLVVTTAIAVGLVGWASGLVRIDAVGGQVAAVIVGLLLLVTSGLIAVLFEPIEPDDESA